MRNRNKFLNILSTYIFIFCIACIVYSCNTASSNDFKEAKTQNTVKAWKKFIEKNPDSDITEKAKELRDKLIFDSIKALNSLSAIEKFIEENPNSVFITEAKAIFAKDGELNVVVGTFRGNETRNYYGNYAPSKLNLKWKFNLGSGQSFAYGKMYTWSGAGWTGQPLVVIEKGKKYIVQGAFDYHLRKIDAETGKEIWRYKFDDILKGTGTIWHNPNAANEEEKCIIMQGSRRGQKGKITANYAPSFRAVSFFSGKELWRLNSKKTDSYSQDVDGSPLVWKDTAYLGLENGILSIYNPDKQNASMQDEMFQPQIYKQLKLYATSDIKTHGGNLVTESCPAYLNGRIYIASGSGHVYGYNIQTGQLDWDFFIGSDMDGSPVVTDDNCILVSLEKEYIKGRGGVYKLDPSKEPNDAVVWFCPTQNFKFFTWAGGIIGTVAVNDYYYENDEVRLAAFTGIDGYMYVVNHKKLSDKMEIGTDGVTKYPSPEIVFKYKVGSSISSPIIVKDKIIAAGYNGIYLFEYTNDMKFKLLDQRQGTFEATPIVYDGCVYIASNGDGFLYCLGE